MSEIEKKTKLELLRILRDRGTETSSQEVATQLAVRGIELQPRTIRLYLQHLEEEGLVARARRGRTGGRTITPAGLAETEDAGVIERLGFIVSQIDQMAYQMNYHPNSARSGTVILNLTLVHTPEAFHALREMTIIFQAGLGMGELIGLFPEGTRLTGITIPQNYFGIGTVCSVTLNGIFLQAGIPVASEFGAILEMREGKPHRFTDLISYSGTTLDPLEIFIKAKLTKVHEAAISGNGRIGVSFRQIPSAASEQAKKISKTLQNCDLDGILSFGQPGQPLLEFPVHEGRTALIVAGGLNPAAAIEEAGIETRSQALTTLYPADKLFHYKDMQQVASEMLRSQD